MTSWRARDIPDLTGRRAIVTGANSGLGFQTALELARHGAAVLMTSRSATSGDDALRPGARRRAGCGNLLPPPRPGRPRLGARVRRRQQVADRHPRQQRRCHGDPAAAHRRRLRDAAGHEPPRSLRLDRSAVASSPVASWRPRRHREQHGPPGRFDELRRPDGRAVLSAVAGLRAVRSWPTCCSCASWTVGCARPGSTW